MSKTNLNQSNDVSSKVFDYAISLEGTMAGEAWARADLLTQIDAPATIENALQIRQSVA